MSAFIVQELAKSPKTYLKSQLKKNLSSTIYTEH